MAPLGEPTARVIWRNTQAYPAHLFESGEIEDATSFIVIAVLFLFDCYVICPNRRRIAMFSHDEWGLSKKVPLQPTDIQ